MNDLIYKKRFRLRSIFFRFVFGDIPLGFNTIVCARINGNESKGKTA